MKGSQPPTDIEAQEREWMIQGIFERLWPNLRWDDEKIQLLGQLTGCAEGDLERAAASVKEKRDRGEKPNRNEIAYWIGTAHKIVAERR